MAQVENNLTIRTFTFDDLTVMEVPTKNYRTLDDPQLVYNLYVSYHRGIGELYFVCGVYEQFSEEHITNLYLNGYFDELDEEPEEEDYFRRG